MWFGKHRPSTLAFIYVISVLTCHVTNLTSSTKIFLDIANLNSTQFCISIAPGSAQYVLGEEMVEGREGIGNLTNSYAISVNLMIVVNAIQKKVHKMCFR